MIILHKARAAVKEFDKVIESPMENQEQFIHKLVIRNRDTLFGRQHRFERIRCLDDYQKFVPVHNYGALGKYMKLIMKGERDVLFPGAPIWWAMTSGTTSKPKLIPVPKDMTAYLSDVGSRLLYSFIMEDPKKNLRALSGKLLFLRAPSKVQYVNGIPAGYISGISGETQSRFSRGMLLPSKATSALSNWEEKFYRIALETVSENVTMIAGVTPLLMSMFQRIAYDYPEQILHDLARSEAARKVQRLVEKYNGTLRPVDYWSNLSLFCSSGASIKPYTSRYMDLFGDTPVREAYGATEGQFGQQVGEEEGLQLNWDKYLFEFIPFHEGDGDQSQDERLLVCELKVGGTYEVLITTPSGLYSYRIGDLLRLERSDPPVFKVVGRTHTTLNLFGEKVCEEHISAAVRAAEDTTRATIAEYSCMIDANGMANGGPRYVLCVEFMRTPKDKRKFIMTWDKKLQEIAPGYGCFRANDAMLKPPEIVAVTRGTFQKYEQKRMRDATSIGQFKLPHVGVGTDLLGELQVAT
jgi:phenylacetate-coenzyme A ligase PaaK-like adenylate-forming protein